MRFWEKTRLEPFAPKKDVVYYVLAPYAAAIIHALCSFMRELSSMYETCNLGRHEPAELSESLLKELNRHHNRVELPAGFLLIPFDKQNEKTNDNFAQFMQFCSKVFISRR